MSGYGSRTDVRKLLRDGRVCVDGVITRDPGFRLPDVPVLQGDARRGTPPQILIDGQIPVLRRWIHLMLHKPAGIVTALEDARHPTVADHIPLQFRNRNVAPVGRLDIDVTGLLLLTSDGVLGHRLASPKWEIDKTYRVHYEGPPLTVQEVDLFTRGIMLPDGTRCLPARLDPVSDGLAFLTIHEGRFHQVKNMMSACGRPVAALCRLRTGPLELDAMLPPGSCRELTGEETAALYAAVSLDPDRDA